MTGRDHLSAPLGQAVAAALEDPRRREAALVGGLLVAGTLELALTDAHAPKGATFVVLLALIALVPLRLRRPFAAFGAGMVVMVVGAAAGSGIAWLFLPVPIAMLLVGTAAAAAPTPRVLAAVAVVALAAGLGVSLVQVHEDDGTASDVAWVVAVLAVLPLAAGRAFRHHAELGALLRERAAGLERRREEDARRAAVAERERIAADLHDVVAHGVSAMVVQAGAARRVVAAGGDREAGRAAIATVEVTGRAALDELRGLLGVLRRDDEALALAPQPTLARVDRLVARRRAEGLPVALVVDGDPRPLPPGLDVTAHRIVEEALADVARRPGATRVDVHVRYRPGELELEVTDDAPGDGGAAAALRERVALFGGDVVAGRRRGDGHVLRARLPLEGAA